jgi:hypothetical protein
VAAETKPAAPAPEALLGPEDLARKGLDLVWVIDCTGSVQKKFDRMRSCAERATRLLSGLLENVAVGLVSYRDQVQGKLSLSRDMDVFSRALSTLRAEKGGDTPEGVDLAVGTAVDGRAMAGRPDTVRAVVVVGDAAPPDARAQPFIERVASARKANPLLSVSCVDVGEPAERISGPPPVDAFWARLALEGGGAAFPLGPEAELLEALCAGTIPRMEKEPLRRVLSLLIRYEGWSPRPFDGRSGPFGIPGDVLRPE